jgi:hypothetical protein
LRLPDLERTDGRPEGRKEGYEGRNDAKEGRMRRKGMKEGRMPRNEGRCEGST